MASATKYKWTFRARFRRNAFGWRSQTPIKRIKEAVSEIKKVARKDSALGGEGGVLFLEKISPAIERVDSSSGAMGFAVNNAIDALAPIIAGATVADTVRDAWLARLWQAVEDDDMPYIEKLPEHWGALCVTPERAACWADRFLVEVRLSWSPDPGGRFFFKGTAACLSAMHTAGRYTEIIELLKLAPHPFWHQRVWGMKALVSLGKRAEALRFADESRDPHQLNFSIDEACEKLLLESGMADEAYRRYAIEANRKTTYLATFRAIVKKYPKNAPADILKDLVASTPGDEGKWFAAAKSAGLYTEAIALAKKAPCDPRTLTRAARDMAESEPLFAVEAGLTALQSIADGYGYEITSADVWAACDYAMKAAENAGCTAETRQRICHLVDTSGRGEGFVHRVLGRRLGV